MNPLSDPLRRHLLGEDPPPEVLAESVARLHVCDADAHLHDRTESCVLAISAPLLAAELRRMATEFDRAAAAMLEDDDTGETMARAEGLREAARRARGRAGELEER